MSAHLESEEPQVLGRVVQGQALRSNDPDQAPDCVTTYRREATLLLCLFSDLNRAVLVLVPHRVVWILHTTRYTQNIYPRGPSQQKARSNTSHCYSTSGRQGMKPGQYGKTGLATFVRGAKRQREPSTSLSLPGKAHRAGQRREKFG